MCVETLAGFRVCIVFVIGDAFGFDKDFVMCHRRISCLGDLTCFVQGNGRGRKWSMLLKVCLKWDIRRPTARDLDVAGSSYLH